MELIIEKVIYYYGKILIKKNKKKNEKLENIYIYGNSEYAML